MEFKVTKEEFDAACVRADDLMKRSNGHYFLTILKTRCQHCGRSPRQARGGKCRGWFQTFLSNLSGILTGIYGAPTAPQELAASPAAAPDAQPGPQ